MRARVGDRLIPDVDPDRVGMVIGLRNEDGSPPYIVRWLATGHVALVFPGPYARIVPGEPAAGSAEPAAGSAEPSGTPA
jgi:hypothetical protein